jgi:hypothetical protein
MVPKRAECQVNEKIQLNGKMLNLCTKELRIMLMTTLKNETPEEFTFEKKKLFH